MGRGGEHGRVVEGFGGGLTIVWVYVSPLGLLIESWSFQNCSIFVTCYGNLQTASKTDSPPSNHLYHALL